MPKYASLTRLKRHLDITDTASDTRLNDLLDAASGVIADHCLREFEEKLLTEDYDSDGSDTFLVNRIPLLRVDSLYDDPDRIFGASTLVATADYVSYEHGEVRRVSSSGNRIFAGNNAFSVGKKSLRLTYLGGYTLPEQTKLDASKSKDLPETIVSVCIELVAMMFHHPTAGILANESFAGSAMQFFANGIPAPLAARLDPYVYYRMGAV